jgi:transposase
MLIQLAWLWLRHQPQSALALWFKERVSRNGGRFKKTDRGVIRAPMAPADR